MIFPTGYPWKSFQNCVLLIRKFKPFTAHPIQLKGKKSPFKKRRALYNTTPLQPVESIVFKTIEKKRGSSIGSKEFDGSVPLQVLVLPSSTIVFIMEVSATGTGLIY